MRQKQISSTDKRCDHTKTLANFTFIVLKSSKFLFHNLLHAFFIIVSCVQSKNNNDTDTTFPPFSNARRN
jgi:hypothetical protein